MKTDNIILCDCVAEEVASLRDGLNGKQADFTVKSHISNWKRTGKFSELRRYGKYFSVSFRYFLSRKRFGVIVGWQQFYALIFCFFCSIFRVKKRNTVIALNFTYKEKKGRLAGIYRWFMRRCVSKGYLDHIHVLSQNYAKIISKEFDYPLEKILVFPFGVNDPYEAFSKLPYPAEAPAGGYALAIGRSNRDYDFLISAWEAVAYPLVVISDTYTGNEQGNPNVRILRNVAGADSYPWIAHCSAMLIPIDDGRICSGDTVLLNALAMKKKTLITSPSTLAEMYIVHGENGLCAEKDRDRFAELASEMLLTNHYDGLQEKARESYLQNYSRMSMGRRLQETLFDPAGLKGNL